MADETPTTGRCEACKEWSSNLALSGHRCLCMDCFYWGLWLAFQTVEKCIIEGLLEPVDE